MTLILEEIRALIDAPVGDDAPTLAHLEDALTGGYARALALEAERLRLERRIGEVAARLGRGEEEGTAELAGLARRLSTADDALSRLRVLLGSLKARAREARVA
jgi:hypothetical protein